MKVVMILPVNHQRKKSMKIDTKKIRDQYYLVTILFKVILNVLTGSMECYSCYKTKTNCKIRYVT